MNTLKYKIQIYSPLLLEHLKSKLSKMRIPFLCIHDSIILNDEMDFKEVNKIIKRLTDKITKGKRK